ncbi:glutamine synthetase, partial [Myxococcota bacterium]|nr:glutamine synthetase [Myxococcota bacterium]
MNQIAKFLDKSPSDFTRADLIRVVTEKDIKMLNFRYVGGDGKLKTLNFVINSLSHLNELLSTGERVDGSSLFRHIPTAESDLYVVPRYRTAFINPFADEPTLDILCSFYDRNGEPLKSAPEEITRQAQRVLKEKTGLELQALGELEFYLFSEVDPIYGITPQRGYHESHPFSKWETIRLEAMKHISDMGGQVKYGHAEVGNIIHAGQEMVQHEIEFLPASIEEAADQLVVAKWIIREVAYRHDLTVSFAPKIIVGHAGSGLHIHSRLHKNGEDPMVQDGALSENAKKLISGFIELAPSLTAFGNTVPTSFLRLVPHQEAPTTVCWGDRNRSALVRVPLGWLKAGNMVQQANPQEPSETPEYS